MAHWLARLRTRVYHWRNVYARWWMTRVWGMDIGRRVLVSRTARLDRTFPQGVHIGDYTLVSFDAAILTHDFVGGRHLHTRVGRMCFIGARSIVMPGVTIGDHCVIGSGAVVTQDIPPRSIAVGNPARVIRQGIRTGWYGIRDPQMIGEQEVARGGAVGREAGPAAPDAEERFTAG